MANTTLTERFLPPSYLSKPSDSIQLNRRRIYILPTRFGFMFTILLLIMLLGSINYNNSMAFILTFLLSSLFFITMLHTYRNLAGLKISATRPEPVYAGETALFPIIINNRSGHARPSIYIVNHPSSRGFWKFSSLLNKSLLTSVNADSINRIKLPVPTMTRGIMPLDRIMIYTYFPLGLFMAWSYINVKQHCIVYPKPSGTESLPYTQTEDNSGIYGLNDGADDFAGFRSYRPGDSIKKIAWKSLAREQGLLVKKFSGNAIKEVNISWEEVSHLNTIEDRLSQLCLWVIAADKNNMVFSLGLPDKKIDKNSGPAHKQECLECLARYGLDLKI